MEIKLTTDKNELLFDEDAIKYLSKNDLLLSKLMFCEVNFNGKQCCIYYEDDGASMMIVMNPTECIYDFGKTICITDIVDIFSEQDLFGVDAVYINFYKTFDKDKVKMNKLNIDIDDDILL